MNKNYVAAGIGMTVSSITDFNISINLEYGRSISKRFDAGILFSKELLRASTDGNNYRGNYLYGMVYYTIPIFSNISLRAGAGFGVGYYREKRSRHYEPEDKVLPFVNLSGHWVVHIHEKWDIRLPLLLFVGPGNFSFWRPSTLSGSEAISSNIELSIPVTVSFKF